MQNTKPAEHLDPSPAAADVTLEEFAVTELEERLEFAQWMNGQCREG